jgi:hypothetical protein
MKIFSPKTMEKAILTQITYIHMYSYFGRKNGHSIGFEQKRQFFAENVRKSDLSKKFNLGVSVYFDYVSPVSTITRQ